MNPEDHPIIQSVDKLAKKLPQEYRAEFYRTVHGVVDSSFVHGISVNEETGFDFNSVKKYLFKKEKESEEKTV